MSYCKIQAFLSDAEKLYKQLAHLKSRPRQNFQRNGFLGLFGRKVDVVDHTEKWLQDLEENVRMQQSDVSLIGEVLIRLMGADEHIYSNYMDSKQWLQDTEVLEMILNKFSSSGPWTPEEDQRLVDYIEKHGHGSWRALPKLADLNRCGKFSSEEERIIVNLHSVIGNKF
ncbi:uncharacterized protein LOC131227722 [Magnolia sinica]|uniref:uncharacterized protein LOC131227722 n=1 Tax=Magnolia sinica TaxID=86752 RepID=UPI00265AA93D|nr:uncharacterized protein LOC131227722 [Magnolia sinica]